MPATTKQIVRDKQTDRQTDRHNTYKQTTKQNANCTHFKPFKPAASRDDCLLYTSDAADE